MSRKTNSNPLWTDSGPVRLQRILAAAGFGSRRSVEQLILAGRVEVDGEVVDQLGSTADPAVQDVRVDGESLRAAKPLYYAVNKPTGVVTTNRDPQGRPRVVDLAPPQHRVFPVGRLDQHSEGLILLTNDGWLAQRLAHPRFGVEKIYQVIIAGEVPPDLPKRMERGIHIAEGVVRAKHVRVRSARARSSELEVVLDEGKNREIRRMLARLGHKVMRLRRIAFGPLRLGDLPIGACRLLAPDEIQKLREAAQGKGYKQRPEGVRRSEAVESIEEVDGTEVPSSKPTKRASVEDKNKKNPIAGGGQGKPFSSSKMPRGKVTIIGGEEEDAPPRRTTKGNRPTPRAGSSNAGAGQPFASRPSGSRTGGSRTGGSRTGGSRTGGSRTGGTRSDGPRASGSRSSDARLGGKRGAKGRKGAKGGQGKGTLRGAHGGRKGRRPPSSGRSGGRRGGPSR